MDGMELLRRLRQQTDMPVIFLTSKDEEIDELFGLKMGADDYIYKPVLPAPGGGARQGGAAALPAQGPRRSRRGGACWSGALKLDRSATPAIGTTILSC